MTRSRRLGLLAALLLVAACTGGPPIESTRDDTSGIHRAVLPNGLAILVLPRPTSPAVAVQIWYRVGSADERDGERGLAHFLEHLMFKGTRSLPKGEIDALTHRNGGRNNAFTGNDVTVYHFTFAPDRWETALRIEADRMRNTIFDPDEFEAERKVVIEELKRGLDEPWDAIDDEVIGAAFRVHPYQHPVIGYLPQIEAVSRETVRAFYERHYTPANATVVVVGRVDPEQAVARVAEAFGGVEGPSAPESGRTPEPAQTGERRVTTRNATTTQERFEMVWHTCRMSNPDDAVLDVISALLGRGRSSWLRERLVEEEALLTEVTVSNDTRRDPGLFWIWGELTSGTDIAKVESVVAEAMERLTGALPAADLTKAKNQAEAQIVFARETSDDAAEEIGSLALGDSWTAIGTRLDRLRAVTAEDVTRVAKTYLEPENRTFGLGSGPRKKAGRQDEETADGGAAIALSPRRIVLPNGLVVIIQAKTDVPVATVRASVRADRMVESRPGLSRLTGKMLLAGAGDRDRDQIAEAVESVGGTLSSSSVGVGVNVLARDLALAVTIVADAIRRPTFPEDELERAKTRTLSALAAEKDSPETLASRRFAKLAYGDGHPLGRHPYGDPESVKTTTRQHLADHHATWFHPDNTVLVVVGDLDPAEAETLVRARFMDWPRADVPSRPAGDVALPAAIVRDRIERPGQQVNVYLGHGGIRRRDPDYVPLVVLDNILGWSPVFSDRLSRELREKRGLCYDTWAAVARSAGTDPGLFTAYVGTSPESGDEAIAAIRGEIERIRDEPVTAEELAAAKSYLTGSWVFRYETAEQIGQRLIEMERWGLGFDAPRKFVEAVRRVTREDVQRVAREHLHPDRLVIVEVGP